MLTRIITAVVLIAAVLAWLFIAQYPVYSMGALFMYMVGAYEMGPLLGYRSRLPFPCFAVAASTALFALSSPGEFVVSEFPEFIRYIIGVGSLVWIFAVPLLLKYPKNTDWHKNIALNTVLGLLMLVPFLLGLLVLRADSYAADPKAGAYLVLSVMALVWCADSGAYFSGRFFGKTPMLPNVSPKKTMEGLLGGLLIAVAGLFIFMKLGWFSNYADNFGALLFAGVLTILFSVVGDLVESMFKRLAGIKDSGKIFPGHGGMLDRIDSQLAAVPIFLTSYWLFTGAFF